MTISVCVHGRVLCMTDNNVSCSMYTDKAEPARHIYNIFHGLCTWDLKINNYKICILSIALGHNLYLKNECQFA